MGRSAIAMVAVGVLTTLAAHAPAADVWVSKEDMPIETNFSVWLYTKAVARGTTAYVLANEAAAYDLAKERWEVIEAPTQRYQAAYAATDQHVYQIGGNPIPDPWPDPPARALEEYDPIADTWKEREEMPTPRAGAMAATSRGKVYVIGGYGGVGYLQAVEEYDPRTDTWVEKADLPVPGLVPLASFGALSEILAVFATADIEAGLPVLSYRPGTDTWTRRDDIPPAPRMGILVDLWPGGAWWAGYSAWTLHRDRLYVVGGWEAGDPLVGSRRAYEYDLTARTWTRLPDMRTRHAHPYSFISDGHLHVIGTWEDRANTSDAMESFDTGLRALGVSPATNAVVTWGELKRP